MQRYPFSLNRPWHKFIVPTLFILLHRTCIGRFFINQYLYDGIGMAKY